MARKFKLKNEKMQIIMILTISIFAYILKSINNFRYPIVMSMFSSDNNLFEYVLEVGSLPEANLKEFSMYQPLIFFSNILNIFKEFFPILDIFTILFPILIYVMIKQICLMINQKNIDKKFGSGPNIIGSLLIMFNFSFPFYNSTFIFFSMLFLVFLYLKTGVSMKFMIFGFLSLSFSIFYYYSGHFIYSLFIFCFFLFTIIRKKDNKKEVNKLLLLSCFNSVLTIIAYLMIPTIGAIGYIQSIIFNVFNISTNYFSIFAIIIVITLHYFMKAYGFQIFNFLKNVFQKNIKFLILIIICLIIGFTLFIFTNFQLFLQSSGDNLSGFNFPKPYFNVYTRFVNFFILFAIAIPYFLYFINILGKLYRKIPFSSLDMIYLFSLFIFFIFIPIYYLLFDLSGVFNRGSKTLVFFSIIPASFFYYDPLSYIIYIFTSFRKNGEIYINSEKKEFILDSKQEKLEIKSKDNEKMNFINLLIIFLIQLLLFFIIRYFSNEFIENSILLRILNLVYFFFLPGLIPLCKFEFKKSIDIFEKFLWISIYSFFSLMLYFLFLNGIKLFYQDIILMGPFLISIIFFQSINLIKNLEFEFKNSRILKFKTQIKSNKFIQFAEILYNNTINVIIFIHFLKKDVSYYFLILLFVAFFGLNYMHFISYQRSFNRTQEY